MIYILGAMAYMIWSFFQACNFSSYIPSFSIDICFNYTATVLFFKENSGLKKYIDCYVSFNNVKILDSRDIDYVKNGGW